MSAADIFGSYLRERVRLISGAESASEAAAALAGLTDRVVSAMTEAALSPLGSPWALVALGGWGAGRLLPGSDLDLLVITGASESELRPALSRVLYPLWDAGLQVGHQVRSAKDHARACKTDLHTLTATLTGRAISGDLDLAGRVLDTVAADALRRRRKLLREMATRQREGSPYLLAPDLKEGAGGQRDLDELVWSGAILSGTPGGGRDALVDRGILSAEEDAKLGAAAVLLNDWRWSLHGLQAHDRERLTLEAAGGIAHDPEELQSALAEVHHLLLRARARLAGERLPWDLTAPTAMESEALFSLLDDEAGLPQLEDAAWSGRLDDLVPALSDAMSWRRPALTHQLTVGAHSLRVASRIASRLAAPESVRAEPGAVTATMRRTAQFAALAHDMGKASGARGHEERGSDLALTVGPRLGLSAENVSDAARLVREHLLLPQVATGEDIHDEDVVLRAAERVGRPDLVDPLLALAAADSEATGPGVWTPWLAALCRELADRISAELSEQDTAVETASLGEKVRAEVLAMAALREDADSLVEFVRHASLRYLAAHSPVRVIADGRLVDAVARTGDRSSCAVSVGTGPAEGTWRVSVAAHDRPGLFAMVAGTLSLSGLDILSAEAYAAPGDVGLDSFVVQPDTLAPPDDARWNLFERHLRTALSGRLDVEKRVRERASHYRFGSPGPTTVSVETPGDYTTAVHVSAPDRIGLLYDISAAIAGEGLDIRWVSAVTRGGIARDVFHVVDSYGEPVLDHGVLGHLAMRIRERAAAAERPTGPRVRP